MMATDVQWRVIMPATAEMKDHVYKILELVGSSEKGIDDAIQNAISRASKTIRDEMVRSRANQRSYREWGCSPLPSHIAGRIYTRGVILSLSPAGDEIIEMPWTVPPVARERQGVGAI